MAQLVLPGQAEEGLQVAGPPSLRLIHTYALDTMSLSKLLLSFNYVGQTDKIPNNSHVQTVLSIIFPDHLMCFFFVLVYLLIKVT